MAKGKNHKNNRHLPELQQLKPMKADEVYDLIMKEFPNAVVKKTPLVNSSGLYGHTYNLTIKPNFAEYGFNVFPDDVVYSVERYRWKGPDDPPENYDVWIVNSINNIDVLKRDFIIMKKMLELGRYMSVVEEIEVLRDALK